MTPHLADTPTLETERLTLRAFGPQDVQPSAQMLMSPRAVYMGGPFTPANAWEYCAALIGHWAIHGFGLFAFCLKDTGQAIGEAGPLRMGGYPENEIGWGLWDQAHEGKGFAAEAAFAARDYAYQTLGWTTAVSYIDPGNARSIALAKRMGATPDPDATLPDLPDWDDTVVYRHPSPEGV